MDEVNKKGQSHTKLSRDLLVFMRPDSSALEESSKRSILRNAAEKTLGERLKMHVLQVTALSTPLCCAVAYFSRHALRLLLRFHSGCNPLIYIEYQ